MVQSALDPSAIPTTSDPGTTAEVKKQGLIRTFVEHNKSGTAGFIIFFAILPLFPQLTIWIGFVVGGSLLVEPIFTYEGIGQRLFAAIQKRDYPLLQGIFLMITISVVLANFAADLLYSRLDPRIRSGRS